MEARYFKDEKASKYEHIFIKVDEYGLKHLQQGHPLRVAFYTDDQKDLPWYRRSIMTVSIGKNINLDECERLCRDRVTHEGILDPEYLLTSAQEIQKTMIQSVVKNLEKIGANISTPEQKTIDLISHEADEAEITASVNPPPPKKYISTKDAADRLFVSFTTMNKWASQGKVPFEQDESTDSLFFVESVIEALLKDPPEFLRKVWGRKNSLRCKSKVASSTRWADEILINGEVHLPITLASEIFDLSDQSIRKKIREGFIKAEMDPKGRPYISKAHAKALVEQKPEWLRKAWREECRPQGFDYFKKSASSRSGEGQKAHGISGLSMEKAMDNGGNSAMGDKTSAPSGRPWGPMGQNHGVPWGSGK